MSFLSSASVDPAAFCHEPLVVTDPKARLETLLGDLELRSRRPGGEALHPDLVLLWTPHEKRVLGAVDLLENLLRGIGSNEHDQRPRPAPIP